MLSLLLLLLLLLLVAFVAVRHHRSYWRRRGVDGPASSFFVGDLGLLGETADFPHPLTFWRWTKRFGRCGYFGIQRGWVPALVVSDPQMAREVLNERFEEFHERDASSRIEYLAPTVGNPDTKSISHVFVARGQRWKRLRALTATTMSTQNLKKLLPMIDGCARRMVENIASDLKQNGEQGGEVLDISRHFQEFTADAVLRMAFGQARSRDEIRRLVPAMDELTSFRDPFLWLSWLLPFFGGPLGVVQRANLLRTNPQFAQLFTSLKADLEQRKAERDAGNAPTEPRDFLDFFLAAECEEDEQSGLQSASDGKFKPSSVKVTKRLTFEEILGSCILFIFAGFDTNSNGLGFIVNFLVKHPDVQQKLFEEIVEVCGTGEAPDYEALGGLRFMDAVFNETLRFATARRCAQTMTLGGVQIERGTDVIVDVFSVHRNRKIWGADADEFRPERWFEPDVPRAHFYGFGQGPRVCIGMKLAKLEEKLALVHLLRRYRLEATDESEFAFESITGFLMRVDNVAVRLVERVH